MKSNIKKYPNLIIRFEGPPGVGKTTARRLAEKVLKEKFLIEYSGDEPTVIHARLIYYAP